MPETGRHEIDEIGGLFETLGAYCVETATVVAADQLALFLHADGLGVRPAFLYTHGHVIVAFLDRAMLGQAIDAFDEGGPVADLTSELDQQLPDDATLSGENLGAFLGPPLRAIAEAQNLGSVVVYMRLDDVDGAMALKFDHGRLLGAADRGGGFVRAMWLIAKAGADSPEGLEGIDLTEAVYQRLGREMPEPVTGDELLADFPDDPWAMTGWHAHCPRGRRPSNRPHRRRTLGARGTAETIHCQVRARARSRRSSLLQS